MSEISANVCDEMLSSNSSAALGGSPCDVAIGAKMSDDTCSIVHPSCSMAEISASAETDSWPNRTCVDMSEITEVSASSAASRRTEEPRVRLLGDNVIKKE